MYKIIGVLLFASFLTAETRHTLPIKLEKSQDVTSRAEENKISYRLPNLVEPKSYTIDLKVYLDENQPKNFTFDGDVAINLNVKEPTSKITLHSQNLNIKKVAVFFKVTNEIDVKYTNENITNFLTIVRADSKNFVTGNYILGIKYDGKLNDDLRGFYRSHYMNGTEKVWLATTHFEPVGARLAIPCFDEPAYKATFDMKITNNKTFTAIFNTKAKTSNDNFDGTVTTEFEKTPVMSTYLLAFVVSNFKSDQNAGKNVSVYARPDAVQFGKLAVEKGEQILKKLEAFTNIPFEIGKMDQIAIPQFTAGAMENWGLVTYREESLLYNEENSTTAKKQNIVETIAHEFAHQWFGNLVSPKWWNYIWLNEGFATFFQSYITEQVENSWRSVEQSVVNQLAFIFDSSNNTHPLNHDVESPKEISKMFDTVSYQKGGAVIRMMQHYLTDDIFKKGLQQYLKDFNHTAANSDDLFNSIQKVLNAEKRNIQVKTVMDAWVNKKGYPIVTVTRDYNNRMELKQERFFTYNASAEDRKNNLWHIPINYATEKNPDFKNTSAHILFNKPNETVSVDGAENNQWIILNKQQTGFYRVNYDEKNWKLITDYLNSTHREKIHPINRAQLINDALAFVKEEILGLQTLIDLTANLKSETDYIAWTPAFTAFTYLRSKLINTEFYPVFKEYVLNATTSLVKSVGLEPTEKDDHIKNLTRIPTIASICYLGHDECLKKMNEKLTAWLKDEKKNSISADLKEITFCNGLRNASSEQWEEVLNKSKTHPDVREQEIMIRALSCSNQKKNIERYLHDALANSTKEYSQNAILNTINYSQVGVDTVLDFIAQNIFKLHWKLNDKEMLIQFINLLGGKITTKDQLEKLKALKNLSVSIPDELTVEAVSLAEKNLNWLKKHNETLTKEFILRIENGVGIITSSIGLITSLLVILFYNNL